MKGIRKRFLTSFLTLIMVTALIPWSYATEKSPEFKSALAQMRTEKDKFTGITWYRDKSSPRYINTNGFFLYLGTKKGYTPSLRLKIQYYGSDWLFIEKYLFKVDGKTYEIKPRYGDVKKDNDSKVWEWFDTSPNKGEIELLKSIVKSKKAIMRIEGSKYYKDVTISSTQKNALGRVLILYEALAAK
jgi:hypothetical protein